MHLGLKLALTQSSPPPSEGGGGEPEWVPEGAVDHIDLVGGSPQGRAWDGESEVSIDTMLGADPNTVNGYGTTAAIGIGDYNEHGLAPQSLRPAFIGTLRASVIDGATIVIKMKQFGEGAGATINIALLSADGNDAIEVYIGGVSGGQETSMSSYGGGLDEAAPNNTNGGVNAENKHAITVTGTRLEVATNGGTALAGVLTSSDRPPGNPFVAALIDWDSGMDALVSITTYAPLASTVGLSELSELS